MGFWSQIIIKLIDTFEKGLDAYFNKNWNDAITYFEKSKLLEEDFDGRNTNPSLVFIDRCKHFIDAPPNESWNGVWKMKTK